MGAQHYCPFGRTREDEAMGYEGGIDWQVYDNEGRRKYLTDDELDRFLAAADRLSPSRRALCYVLVYTGCRLSEALALTTHQLDTERRRIVLRTLKRRRIVFRAVPIPDKLFTLLSHLPVEPGERYWPIHRATAWENVKNTMALVGITGPMASPKGIRHGFAIRAAWYDVPQNLIRRWMGHARPETTGIYIDAVGSEERNFASRMW